MNVPLEWQELMAGYVLGDLDAKERQALEAWLEQNPQAREELESLRVAASALPYTLDEAVAPGNALRERVIALTATPASPPVERSFRVIPLRRWLGAAGAVAAALVIGFLGYDGLQLRQQLDTAQQEVSRYRDLVAMLRDGDTRLVALKGMDSGATASGNIVITPGTPEVVVTLRNLPMPPQGESYRLWAVVEGRKLPMGEFKPGSGGSVLAKLPLNARLLSAPLVITREPVGAPTGSGPMVMTSGV